MFHFLHEVGKTTFLRAVNKFPLMHVIAKRDDLYQISFPFTEPATSFKFAILVIRNRQNVFLQVGTKSAEFVVITGSTRVSGLISSKIIIRKFFTRHKQLDEKIWIASFVEHTVRTVSTIFFWKKLDFVGIFGCKAFFHDELSSTLIGDTMDAAPLDRSLQSQL